jgi:membrane dipeptidase
LGFFTTVLSDLLKAPFSLLMQHIEYLAKLVGVDYVGVASNFDGIQSSPLQLDVST